MILAADLLAKHAMQETAEEEARKAAGDAPLSAVERQHFQLQYYADGDRDAAWLEKLRQTVNPAAATAFRESIRNEVAVMLAVQASAAKN